MKSQNTEKQNKRLNGYSVYQKRISLILIALLFVLCTPLQSISDGFVSLEVSEISVTEKDSSHMKGSFDIINSHEQAVEAITWAFQLYYNDGDQSNLVYEKKNNFSINQMETKKIDFNMLFPQRLVEGQYFLIIRLYERTGIAIGIGYLDLEAFGDKGGFLTYDYNESYFLKQNSEKVGINTGPNYKPNESPQISISIKNPSIISGEINAFAQVYKRSAEFSPVPVFDDKIGTFNLQGEPQKNVILNLPGMKQPESYLSKICFKDTSGNTISGILEARYVVEGASAKFIDPRLSNIDNTAVFEGMITGPADGFQISGANLTINAFVDGSNTPIKTVKKTLNIGTVQIPLSIKLLDLGKEPQKETNIKVSAIITYEGNTLDSFEYVFKMAPETIQKPIFKDIAGTVYEQFVMPLYKMGLISGFEDNTFRPEEKFTRAQFATLACGLENIKEMADSHKSDNLFKDISQKHWAAGFVNLVKVKDLMNGYPDHSFKPNAFISFAELVTFLVRWIEKDDGIDQTLQWPYNYVKRSDELQIAISSNYQVRGYITRGKMSEIFLNAIRKKKT